VTARDGADFMKKRRAIALDSSASIVFRESEIQVALAEGAGGAPYAGRKSVYEPGKLAELAGAKDC
jgi:hypothetical protein